MASQTRSRRDMFRMVGGLGVAALLVGCGGDDDDSSGTAGSGGSSGSGGASGEGGASAGSGGSSAGSSGTDAGSAGTGAGEAGTSSGAGGESGSSGQSGTGGGAGTSAGVDWATTGTAVMVGKDYGNPFASGVGETCTVYKSSTGGPCHATATVAKLTRKDVSEGEPGVPMRLELLIVDSDCNPVANPTVEIWHCSTQGLYSGDIDGNNDDFCTDGDAAAAAALWYRGIQTGGADGRVTFDTNFPGWYSGRATHIHFKVTANGKEYLTSQLFVDEALKTEIYSSQPNYKAPSGQGYQLNATDQVVKEASLSLGEVSLSHAKQSDGAMLAWKAITISA